jgi:hypothetical protein
MEEIWKKIIGFRSFYEVSNYGNVRSINRIVIRKTIKGFENLNYTGRILKPYQDTNGYFSVRLSSNSKAKTIRVHRLVAMAFIENPENKETINHKDGNKLNNNCYNLEWATYLENNQHAVKTGLIKRNKTKGINHKISVSQFSLEMVFIKNWDSVRHLCKELNLTNSCILKCINGKYKSCYGFIWKKQ